MKRYGRPEDRAVGQAFRIGKSSVPVRAAQTRVISVRRRPDTGGGCSRPRGSSILPPPPHPYVYTNVHTDGRTDISSPSTGPLHLRMPANFVGVNPTRNETRTGKENRKTFPSPTYTFHRSSPRIYPGLSFSPPLIPRVPSKRFRQHVNRPPLVNSYITSFHARARARVFINLHPRGSTHPRARCPATNFPNTVFTVLAALSVFFAPKPLPELCKQLSLRDSHVLR